MTVRESSAVWEGSSREGKGSLRLGSGVYDGPYTWASRFKDDPGTNSEELIAAAHASCFSMSLASRLTKAGHTPARIDTTAKVHIGEGPKITLIELETVVDVPGIDEQIFLEIAEQAKTGCPVSMALAAVEITLIARLA